MAELLNTANGVSQPSCFTPSRVRGSDPSEARPPVLAKPATNQVRGSSSAAPDDPCSCPTSGSRKRKHPSSPTHQDPPTSSCSSSPHDHPQDRPSATPIRSHPSETSVSAPLPSPRSSRSTEPDTAEEESVQDLHLEESDILSYALIVGINTMTTVAREILEEKKSLVEDKETMWEMISIVGNMMTIITSLLNGGGDKGGVACGGGGGCSSKSGGGTGGDGGAEDGNRSSGGGAHDGDGGADDGEGPSAGARGDGDGGSGGV